MWVIFVTSQSVQNLQRKSTKVFRFFQKKFSKYQKYKKSFAKKSCIFASLEDVGKNGFKILNFYLQPYIFAYFLKNLKKNLMLTYANKNE